jgi:glycosyltransferase involved in cell wall biosynthesis
LGDYKLVATTTIILVTDAWHPQVNGVVTTYKNIISNIQPDIHIEVIHPELFKNITVPFYNEVKIAFCSYFKMSALLTDNTKKFQELGHEVYYHIATEGVLGLNAKKVLDNQKKLYTTAYHTKFPEFFKEILNIPICFTKWYFDWFHKKSKFVMCSSISSAEENSQWNTKVLGKGYANYFTFNDKKSTDEKILLYVGRVSREKNIEEFCKLNIHNCKKIIIGDGPDLSRLKKKYPNIEFTGYKFKEELAEYYKKADVFVFPSKVDTYGIVMLEAMACGTPVAAFNVTGPKDQIINNVNGYISTDLELAVKKCFSIPRLQVANSVKNISWGKSSKDFVEFVTK